MVFSGRCVFDAGMLVVISWGLLVFVVLVESTGGSPMVLSGEVSVVEVEVDWWVLLVFVLTAAAFAVWAGFKVARNQDRPSPPGAEGLIGKVAVVKTRLAPRGTVFIHGELWEATIDDGEVAPEEEVLVTGVKGLKLRVTRIKQEVG